MTSMIPSSCVQFRWLDGHAAIPANQIPSQIDHWDGLRSPHCSILRRPLTIHLVESRCIRVGMVWLGWGGQYGMVGDMTSKPHMYSSDASSMFFKPRSVSVNLSVKVIWKSFQTELAEKSIGWTPPLLGVSNGNTCRFDNLLAVCTAGIFVEKSQTS